MSQPPETRAHTTPLSLPAIYLITLVLAACSLIYELVLAQTLSALLGNTVLRYSITIGCYLGALGLGAMACGRAGDAATARLLRVELALSLVGGLAVPAFFVLDLGLGFVFPDSVLGDWMFLAATHALIFAVGFLSGFEIPLLMGLAEEVREGVGNRVLAIDYFGALIGSILFPLVLLPGVGLVATGFAVAGLNVLVFAGLAFHCRRYALVGLALALVTACGGGLAASARIEARFAEQLFDTGTASSWGELWSDNAAIRVEHYRSPYQAIDIVHRQDPTVWLFNVFSDRQAHEPDHPDDLWLYLDGQFQLFSGGEEFYHEWFIHVPIQATGVVPRRVLLIGAGDGMALRELLEYGEIERVVQVELDPKMIELAREHPDLRALNGDPYTDPRVELAFADAFGWLRRNRDRFDAVYVDAPYARDHNLSRLYSREFYAMIRARLEPGGFLAFDAPSGWCEEEGGDWPVYSSTLLAAGFTTVRPYLSRVSLYAPQVEAFIAESMARARSLGYDPERIAEYPDAWRWRLARERANSFPVHEFIFASVGDIPRAPRWRDFGVHFHALAPEHLALSFDHDCVPEDRADAVNTVFHPTLPEPRMTFWRDR